MRTLTFPDPDELAKEALAKKADVAAAIINLVFMAFPRFYEI